MHATQKTLGSIVSLWRYPVKSMMGEELNATDVAERGIIGDRSYALVDTSSGKVVSAKNPSKWPNLFDCRATFLEPPHVTGKLPLVRITLPNGRIVTSGQADINEILSRVVGRDVTLAPTAPQKPGLEEYWPDIEGLARRDVVTDEVMPEGTFFDCAVIHLLTTATLARLAALYPQGRFETRRFRPNMVVQIANGEKDFPENAWVEQTIAIGDAVRLSITGPCPRCVMTTLAQGDLPKDPGILRAIAQHNYANVGVYAAVLRGGKVLRGDAVRME